MLRKIKTTARDVHIIKFISAMLCYNRNFSVAIRPHIPRIFYLLLSTPLVSDIYSLLSLGLKGLPWTGAPLGPIAEEQRSVRIKANHNIIPKIFIPVTLEAFNLPLLSLVTSNSTASPSTIGHVDLRVKCCNQ